MIGQQNKREDRKSDSLTNRQADKQIDRDRRDRDKTQTDKQKKKKKKTRRKQSLLHNQITRAISSTGTFPIHRYKHPETSNHFPQRTLV